MNSKPRSRLERKAFKDAWSSDGEELRAVPIVQTYDKLERSIATYFG